MGLQQQCFAYSLPLIIYEISPSCDQTRPAGAYVVDGDCLFLLGKIPLNVVATSDGKAYFNVNTLITVSPSALESIALMSSA